MRNLNGSRSTVWLGLGFRYINFAIRSHSEEREKRRDNVFEIEFKTGGEFLHEDDLSKSDTDQLFCGLKFRF